MCEWPYEEKTYVKFHQLEDDEFDQAVNQMSESAAGLMHFCKECMSAPKEDCAKCQKGKGAQGKQKEKEKGAQGKQTEKGKGAQGKQKEKEKESQGKQKYNVDYDDEFSDEVPAWGMSREPLPRPCRHFVNGECNFGKNCRNWHPNDEELRVIRGEVWKKKEQVGQQVGPTPDFDTV